ncbi:MAG: ABC transporter ATP-binding protein [Anaerolineae bacterium]|nr:ABC transporter ATP-binding protein [Anaerolineae bacterium]
MTLLTIDHLTKRFGGLIAVDDVSFEIEQGEVLGLIGPNGAGKTTLFNSVAGTYIPEEGQVIFNGAAITGLAAHDVCQLGLVRTFQIVKPFAALNVLDNVKVGAYLRNNNSQITESKARDIVDFVGLGDLAHQPAKNLTTAGRKRLELARALATEPKLMLLDEVMAGLTPTESQQIVTVTKQIKEEYHLTLLVIEHVMQAIMSLSDRIAVLHHGQLIAIDTPQAIAADKAVIEAYLGKEFQFADN